jgi:hypothetical protein
MPGMEEKTLGPEKLAIPPAFTRQDIIPVLSLLILLIFMYYPLMLGRPVMPDTWERFEPWNSDLGLSGPTDPAIAHSNNDAILLYVPWNKIAHDQLRDGHIPAWDQYCLGGVPLLQNHLVPVFYPVYALIAWLFSPLLILGVSGFFHTLIMAIFFYLFIKEWQDNRISAWASASFLIVSLLPAAHYQPWPITIAFFPAIWFFHERWLKHRNLWAGLWMSLCWSVPLLAGYPSLFVQLTIFTLVWFFVRTRMIDPVSRPDWKRIALIFTFPFILGLGISMAQNIPTLMASANSDRVVFKSSQELASDYSWAVPQNEPWQEHLKRLLQPILPVKFRSNDFLNRGNVGIIPFIFAMFGLTGWRRKGFPKSVVWMAMVVAPFALIPALNFAVYWITRALLIDPNPPLEVLGFLILMLSAIGVKRWIEIADLEKPVEIKFTTALVPTGVGIFIALIGSIFISRGSFVPTGDPTFMAIAAAGIIISAFLIDSEKHFSYAIGAISLCLVYSAIMSGTFVLSDFTSPNSINPMPETETIRALEKMVDTEHGGNWGRIIRYSNGPVDAMSIPDQSYTFYPNLGTYFEIPDAFGYHNLAPRSRFELLREIQPEMVIERRGIVAFTPPVDLSDQRLFNLGVRYVLSDSAIEGLIPLNENVDFPVYDLYGQVKRPTPPLRVRIIPSVETLESGETINIRRLPMPEIHLDEPGRFVAVADYEFPGLLVFNEGFAPGWSVNVDGDKCELKTYENFAMGVDIESGEHVVEFRYSMPGWKEGMTVTVTSLLIWIVIGVLIIPEKIVKK